MAILDTIGEVKSYLADIKRKYRFRKARLAREKAADLQATLAQCRGKLEICRKDFNRAINTQSKNIVAGKAQGADTMIQEQILWDAAIGYMLVKDAAYALETISSYDAVSHAYEMLDAAMKQVGGKKSTFPNSMKVGSTKERNAYGYLTSATLLREKEEILDNIFEKLKLTGNIEQHLDAVKAPGLRDAELRNGYTGQESSELDAMMARLDGVDDGSMSEAEYESNMDTMMDIHPPVKND